MNGFDDDLLRDALAGGGVEPPRPPFDDVRHRARAAQRRGRMLAGGALAVAVAAAGGLAWATSVDDGGERDETDLVTDGGADGTASTTTTAASTTTSPVGVPALVLPDPGPRPEQVVAVDEHGRLVVVEAGSGEVVRELDAEGDPTEPVPPGAEIGPNVLDDVALSPDGVVYYTSVGEPVSGSVRRLGIDGSRLDGEERYWTQGNDVAVRPDGAAVAHAFNVDVGITPTSSGPYASGTGQLFGPWATEDGRGQLGALDWSVDGTSLAVARLDWGGLSGSPTHWDILVAPAGGGGPNETTVLQADGEDRTYTDPAFRRDGALIAAEQDWCEAASAPNACGNAIARVLDPATGDVLASFEYGTDAAVVDQSYDTTGTWLLVTFDDGTLRWFGSGESGAVPGRYRAADW